MLSSMCQYGKPFVHGTATTVSTRTAASNISDPEFSKPCALFFLCAKLREEQDADCEYGRKSIGVYVCRISLEGNRTNKKINNAGRCRKKKTTFPNRFLNHWRISVEATAGRTQSLCAVLPCIYAGRESLMVKMSRLCIVNG
jgi:hypothetical protein